MPIAGLTTAEIVKLAGGDSRERADTDARELKSAANRPKLLAGNGTGRNRGRKIIPNMLLEFRQADIVAAGRLFYIGKITC